MPQNQDCHISLPGFGVFPTIFSSSLAVGERGKEEKKVFSGGTPAPPAEGQLPSCTTRERRARKRREKGFFGGTPAPPAEGLPPSCTTRERAAAFLYHPQEVFLPLLKGR